MTWLLDVNLLIALIDPAHVAHDAAHAWFEATGSASWASCPLTENGVIRIVGNPNYPNSPGSPPRVAAILAELRTLTGHMFWPDDLSLVDSEIIDPTQLLTSAQVTDSYLLALASRRGGRLATFDRKLSSRAVRGGHAALEVIGSTRVN